MFENIPIAASARTRHYIHSMLVGTMLGALLCIGIGVAALHYENSLHIVRFTPVASSTDGKNASSKVSAAASTATTSPAPAAPVTTTGTASVVPACVPDTADASLSTLDVTNAAPGLTQVIDPDHTYQIYGNNSSQVRQQISSCAPKLSANDIDEFTAYTTYKISWQYGYQDDGAGQCHLVNVKLGLHIAKVMPAVTFGATTSARFVSQWQTFMSNLSHHEQGHVDLNTQYAGQILTSLQTFPATSCSAITASVSALIDSQVAQLDAAQAAYDDNTNHGATQGAILP